MLGELVPKSARAPHRARARRRGTHSRIRVRARAALMGVYMPSLADNERAF